MKRSTNAPKSGVVKADWSRRGFSFDVWNDPPGQVWSDFVHETDELAMLLEGEIEFAFGGKTFRPLPGEEVMIPAGVRHTVVNVGATPNRWCFGYRFRQ